ncbi:MAG: diguanylate cyclase [Gemmatimonadales bacterium]
MKRAGAWLAPALCVAGSTAVFYAVWRGTDRALLAAAGGFLAASGFALALWRRWTRIHPALSPPLDFREALDLLRRAHGARAAWAVGLQTGPLAATAAPDDDADDELDESQRRRGPAIVELASADGREHVVRDPPAEGVYVAIGDFPYGAGVLLPAGAGDDAVRRVLDDLRPLLGGMRAAETRALDAQMQVVARQLALSAAGTQTLDGIARAGAELAQQLSQRGALIVVAEDDGGRVVAVSSAADKRLLGLHVQAGAPVARAMQTGLPVVTYGADDILGPPAGVPDRRRGERAGAAYPLMDARLAAGALVLVGSGAPLESDAPLAERLRGLAAELGPRLAAAKAVHDAKRRAVLDPLTGLNNRGEFERVLSTYRHGRTRAAAQPPLAATLVYVDLDWFKRLNDTLGHAAGDAALRHVARILESAVRDGDLVARIGGEEFAVWLPGTPLREGWEVAERIRETVASTPWHWTGTRQSLTASCGVASYPEPVRDLLNLTAAADAALYKAKQGGRNRVEKAGRGG